MRAAGAFGQHPVGGVLADQHGVIAAGVCPTVLGTSGSTRLIGYNLFIVIGSLVLRVPFMNFTDR